MDSRLIYFASGLRDGDKASGSCLQGAGNACDGLSFHAFSRHRLGVYFAHRDNRGVIGSFGEGEEIKALGIIMGKNRYRI